MCVSPLPPPSLGFLQRRGSAPPPVRISWLPERHMWCTLMRRIFNPADLHLHKFPLPVRPRNGSQRRPFAAPILVCVCVRLGPAHVCTVPRYLFPFFFFFLTSSCFGLARRADCSQMLIHGGLQTAISLISCSEDNVRRSAAARPAREGPRLVLA